MRRCLYWIATSTFPSWLHEVLSNSIFEPDNTSKDVMGNQNPHLVESNQSLVSWAPSTSYQTSFEWVLARETYKLWCSVWSSLIVWFIWRSRRWHSFDKNEFTQSHIRDLLCSRLLVFEGFIFEFEDESWWSSSRSLIWLSPDWCFCLERALKDWNPQQEKDSEGLTYREIHDVATSLST